MDPGIGIGVLVGTALIVGGLIYRDFRRGKQFQALKELLKEKKPHLFVPPQPDADEAERFWAYYELQYQRVATHESYRLQVSNFVLAGSVVALG
jgi:hypothetical protein